jgi:Trypsin-like peptidase domain
LGTGFFTGVKVEGQDRYFMYLVTAKHVLTDDSTGKIQGNALIRLNKHDGTSEFIHLGTTLDKQDVVFTSPDNAHVDLVVIPVFLDQAKYDFMFVSDDTVLTKDTMKQLEISEGDDVFFTGLFLPYLGQGRNYPIVRSGKVALITEEKIPWRTDVNKPTDMAELLLVETQSFGGNSGSPVFVTVPSAGRTNLRLIGVMKGTFEQNRPVEAIQNTAVSVAKQNLGIAAVIPAYLLHDILFGEPLIRFRKTLQDKLPTSPSDKQP